MTMSLSTGLVSGMDTGALVSQLIATEAAPQTALKVRLKTAEAAASAYRTVNTTFLAVSAAAEAATRSDIWTPVKATSSTTAVTVSAGASAARFLTFKVLDTAKAHSVLNKNAAWTTATSAYGASSITVSDKDGVAKTPAIAITDADGDGTHADRGRDRHQQRHPRPQQRRRRADQLDRVRAAGDQQDHRHGQQVLLSGSGSFTNPTLGADARIGVGDTLDAFEVSSATNTFSNVMPGASFTVSKADATTDVTITVSSDRTPWRPRCRRWSTPSTRRWPRCDGPRTTARAAPPRSRATTP